MKEHVITPKTTIATLAEWPMLAELVHRELVVYLRLIAASALHGKKLTIKNRDLLTDPRGAAHALRGLEEKKLIKTITRAGRRTVEIL